MQVKYLVQCLEHIRLSIKLVALIINNVHLPVNLFKSFPWNILLIRKRENICKERIHWRF